MRCMRLYNLLAVLNEQNEETIHVNPNLMKVSMLLNANENASKKCILLLYHRNNPDQSKLDYKSYLSPAIY